MFSISSEELIPLVDAAASIPSARGKGTLHLSTLHRWRTRGISGIRLEARRVGGTYYTTHEAIQRFIDAINADTAVPNTPAARSRARQAEIERAERELSEAGV